MTVTTLRRRKDKMYGVIPSGGDYLALIPTGGSWLAAAYVNGTWVADIATQALTADPTLTNWIGLFDDRYLVVADATALDVWDLDTDTVESYAAPAGWLLAGGGIVAGQVYWVEFAEAWGGGPVNFTVQARLRTAANPADLTAVSTVSTHTFTDNFDWAWHDELNDERGFVLNTTAAMGQRTAVGGGPVQIHIRFRFPLSGGTPEDDGSGIAGGGTTPWLNYGIPNSTGGSFDSGGTVDDDVLAELVALWPASEPWITSVFNQSTNVAITEFAIFGNVYSEEAGNVSTLTRSAATGPFTTPTAQFAVSDHPTEGSPSFFFIRG